MVPAPSPTPLRRKKPAPVAPPAWTPVRARLLNYALVFVTVVLVVDALVGEKGLLDTMRARRQHAELSAAIASLKVDNTRLRDEIRRYRDDPSAIEALARQELGLMREGEVLFIVRDSKPFDKAQGGPERP